MAGMGHGLASVTVGTPIQIVVSRDREDRRTDAYVDTLRLAFEGSAEAASSPNAYVADAVDLGIRVLEPARDIRESEIRILLGGAQETVVVVIGDKSAQSEALEANVGSERVVLIDSPPASTGPIQVGLGGTEEHAFAPVVATLRTMERARRVLATRIDGEAEDTPLGILKMFISHAKTDGIAMAKSLIGVLRQLQEADPSGAGFEYFYDAEHIAPGTVWREVLEAQAKKSVLIALRTEAYESRYWCRREFLLAESNGMPIVAVDLRREQYHASALLPFDVVPSIRVHDGNLIRVVLHAMGMHLRALRVASGAARNVKVLSHRPSVYSLAGAGRAGAGFDEIAYPAPKVPDCYDKAVQPILKSGEQAARLVTFDELE